VWALAVLLVLIPEPAHCVFYQKHYVVKQYQGKDVLCDPYVVQEDDSVSRVLKQRGDISHKDFPRFLRIFKHINPDVGDVDLIYPKDRILIPLRVLAPGTLAGQESGEVTIPVVTITDLPEALKRYSEKYRVRYGDWVSRLISERFGDYGTQAYKRGVKLFKRLNPDIEDLDEIQAGMEVRLPDPDVRNQDWYEALFKESDPEDREMHKSESVPVQIGSGREAARAEAGEAESSEPSPSVAPPVQWFEDLSVFAKAAEILGAELLDSGQYFFPRPVRGDFRLDLSRTPVLAFENGPRFLFTKRRWISPAEQMAIQQHWENLEVMFVQGEPELSSLLEDLISAVDPAGYKKRMSFKDRGVSIVVRGQFIYNNPGSGLKVCLSILSEPEMRTPQPVCDYLSRHHIRIREWVEKEDMSGWLLNEAGNQDAQKKMPGVDPQEPARLVRAITEMLGYRYYENVEVSFPYAGFQVKATTNLLSMGDQAEMLVDYGSLKGDAVRAIEDTGFKILKIEGRREVEPLLRDLAEALPIAYDKAPIFWTADRPRIYNTSIEIPGYLVSAGQQDGGPGVLLTRTKLPGALLEYLQAEGVSVMHIRQ
ncbi:MAG: hypothetical protein ACOCS6_03290, partial [Desulfosalsimonas sp.]